MDWISIEEKLPETQESVLVFCGKSMRVASYCMEGWILSASYHECDENDEDWDYDCIYLNVTHWMELPDRPHTENNQSNFNKKFADALEQKWKTI
jgi:hypothetical protein